MGKGLAAPRRIIVMSSIRLLFITLPSKAGERFGGRVLDLTAYVLSVVISYDGQWSSLV